MSNWVIVAIPDEDDYVWKISSEKVPHMTILNLGEHDNGPQAAKIISYLEHASGLMLHRFWMSVDRRDTLGPKDADALLFDKNSCGEELQAFRDALLKCNDILDLYNETPQFPEWTPHLTLGYPESPAAEDNRDYPGIHSVQFNKIALWINDFDGPEFNLKGWDSLAMSDMGGPTPSVSNVAWSKYKKSDYTLEQWHKACLIHQHTGAPDSKAQCKLPVRTPDGTLNRNGVHAAAAALAGARGGVNATEDEISKAKASIRSLYTQLGDDMPESMMAHSDDPLHIMDVIAMVNDVMPGDIMHFGVKGMRWGVRKADSGSSSSGGSPPRMKINPTDKAVTKNVKRDYNNLSDKEFSRKYATSKKTYARRVEKHGDPFARRSDRLKTAEAKKTAKLDKKWEKQANTLSTYIKLNNAAAARINPSLQALNSLPRYKDKDFSVDSPLRRKYYKDVEALVNKHYGDVAREHGTNISGTRRIEYKMRVYNSGEDHVTMEVVDVEHAEFSTSGALKTITLKVDPDTGFVLSFDLPSDVLEQGIGVGDDDMIHLFDAQGHIFGDGEFELFHFGIKGMKWGVRRARGADGRVASEDAKVASDLKAKVKSGGLDALTNHELQKLTTRLNLEQNYSRLTAEPSKLDKAAKVSKTTLKLGKSANEAVSFVKSPVGKALIALVAGKGGKVALARLKG